MVAYDVVTSVSAVTGTGAEDVFRVYDAVFGDLRDYAAWRSQVWDRHVARPGFRLARAHDDGRLVGFGYGYTGERGQWWTDRMARLLPGDTAHTWLGGHFELVSLAVLESHRRRGVGRGLLGCLTAELPHDRWLLMTSADAQDPARHLYARTGWEVIGPGLRDGQVVMGRRPT